MRDFFEFRTMISPTVIQVVFVLGLIAIVIGAIGAIANDEALFGILLLVFGALYWRVVCEFIIVVFRMNSSLTVIRANTSGLAPALPSPPSGPESLPGESAMPAGSSEAVSASAADELPTSSATLPPEGWYDDSERPVASVGGTERPGGEGRRALFGLNADEVRT